MLFGMTTSTSPGEILAGNIRAARGRKALEQQDVADRMRALGWTWVRQTVGEVEKNRRRLSTAEIYGLAIALGTSIPALMAPADDDDDITFPSGLELSVTAAQMLAKGLPNIGVTWYGNKPVFNMPAATAERYKEIFGDSKPE